MRKLLPILFLVLVLTGCKIEAELRPDTIVDIPLDPTDTVTESVTEDATEPEETTEPATDPPTQPPTQKATEKPRDDSKKSSGKKSSGKKTSTKDKDKPTESPTKATKPTEPPTKATQPPTDPPTEPPTQPPTEPPTQPADLPYSPTQLDKAIMEAINARRTEAGLPELDTFQKLGTAAALRAEELTQTWSHTRPDGSDFSTVLVEIGIDGDISAENLFYTTGPADAEALVAKWMGSEQHRENILAADMKSMGVATAEADGVTYIAALFIG